MKYNVMALLTTASLGGCPTLPIYTPEETSNFIVGKWKAENGTRLVFDGSGLDKILVEDELIFDNERKVVYNESIWGYYGFKENATTTFADNYFRADLEREEWDYDIPYYNSAILEGTLQNPKQITITFAPQEGYIVDSSYFSDFPIFTKQD